MQDPTKIKMNIPEPLPEDLMCYLEQQCEAALQKIPRTAEDEIDFSQMSYCHIPITYPMTWRQVKDVSRLLTARYDMPVLVMPKNVPMDCKDVKSGFYTGEFRTFEAHIMLTKVDLDKQVIFDVGQVFERLQPLDPKDKTGPKVHDCYYWIFSGETPPTKGTSKPELTPHFSKYSYMVTQEHHNIVLYSDVPLELGQIYHVGGLSWIAQDKKNTSGNPYQNVFTLADWAVPIRNLLTVDEAFFKKFKGLTHEEIRDAVAFPFEHSLRAYKNLLFSAIFYIRSQGIPLNILLMGNPNTTKSAFLGRMAAISGDKFVDGGACTLKGLMPSFAPKAQSSGAIASARNFVIVNEFLHVVKRVQSDKMDSSYNILDTMKQILEGKPGYVPSGIGAMTVRMRGSMFLASNWAEIGGDKGRMVTVKEMYDHISAAFLDRLLIYPIDAEAQGRMRVNHTGMTRKLMSEFTLKTGITDENEILEKMPSPYALNTYDFRTLLSFKEGLVATFEPEATMAVNEKTEDICSKHSYTKLSRTSDMLNNLASAKAFERMLINGEVSKDTKEVVVKLVDVEDAVENFINHIMVHFQGIDKSLLRSNKEWISQSATEYQSFIIKLLWDWYVANHEPKQRRLTIDEVYEKFTHNYSKDMWNISIRPLIERRIIAWDGKSLMWIPHWLNEAEVTSFFVGRRDTLTPTDEVLRATDGEFDPPWKVEPPPVPTLDIQKPVLETLRALPVRVKLDEIQARTQTVVPELVANAVLYLHLAGEISGNDEGYIMRGEVSPKKEMRK